MARDEPGGYPPTAQVVSGMEVARAWSGLRCGTCEPVVPRPQATSGAVLACGRRCGFGHLIWPHSGRLIWPHLRPIATRPFEPHEARAGGRREDGIESG